MASIQSLKKELRGIRSTQKLTRAMRTVSAAKFSKLNGIWTRYAEYARQCRGAFAAFQGAFQEAFPQSDPDAPPAYVVLAANRGMCGAFNREVLHLAEQELSARNDFYLVACGKKAIRFFRARGMTAQMECSVSDVPSLEEGEKLLDALLALRAQGKISGVYVVYPRYVNMMTQQPAVCGLFQPGSADGPGKTGITDQPGAAGRSDHPGTVDWSGVADGADAPALPDGAGPTSLFVPDRSTALRESARMALGAMFYGLMLEEALGAQAATLLTMRSAYDTATELCEQLEGVINRKRQSSVTADVIETSSGESALEGTV